MGRKQINHEQTPARFPAGTLERIDAALEDGERSVGGGLSWTGTIAVVAGFPGLKERR